MDQPLRIRHIHIESGTLNLHYRAPAEQAQDVADALAASHPESELSVTIDDEVQEDLPPLPCTQLWE
ncbi:hypothetical protein OHA40_30265 [Nocardia sp. NBC_00508]|uniref:hypothetical protein n=1 Tax=Nocardia sp. NBC_00508 TaxID=2975992 RepID=UPI002E80F7B1|nr:hypothetical protein [Nocardia sp. NBC_00508]WUD65839.1 hypothetical protein OHA40_30265 [Nocardia sp. NBC_00508]